jgi:hypothetical protein
MSRFYCTADNAGPAPTIDWSARQASIQALAEDEREAAQTALHAERIACPSHLVRNGNGPRLLDHSSDLVADGLAAGTTHVEIGDSRDEHGGGLASLALPDGTFLGSLRCPECLAPLRARDS